MSDDDELAKLKKEIADLKQRIDPPPRPRSNYAPKDYTEGMSMDRSAMQAMIDAVPDALMRSLREDARRPNPVTSPSSMIPTSNQPSETKRGSGWRESTANFSPRHLAYRCNGEGARRTRPCRTRLAACKGRARQGQGMNGESDDARTESGNQTASKSNSATKAKGCDKGRRGCSRRGCPGSP